MASTDPNSVDDIKNLKSLDDIKGSPECTCVSILSKNLLHTYVVHTMYVRMYKFCLASYYVYCFHNTYIIKYGST